MSETNKSYRIRTKVGTDSFVNVNLTSDYETFNILSLNISKNDMYKLHSSNYGCIVGRVLANDNFGIPNVKVSIFVRQTEEVNEDPILSELYPYVTVADVNSDDIRYNLLPNEKQSDCHKNVGTFPSKRMVLDDNNMLEIFDNFYKYTTVTNNSGDYMIFGVPVGTQIIHTEFDISDIGALSQTPRDMMYKGYSINQFESPTLFKSDTNLDTLTQIFKQDDSIDVNPFWGEENESIVGITRKDIKINYKFEPTCIFIGSIVTDPESEFISRKCIPTSKMGKMDELTTGDGTIEMIRLTPNGNLEQKHIMGDKLIDGNGTWCYQIPMNLDYMSTDEYGNLVPSNDPSKGIPTRAKVRFRIGLNGFDSQENFTHISKALVPNNPKTIEEYNNTFYFGNILKTKSKALMKGAVITEDIEESQFRDLFWNNVYTVKSYVPNIRKGNYFMDKRFTGIKAVNANDGKNHIPYNKLRIHISFVFVLQCAILRALIMAVKLINIVFSLIDMGVGGFKDVKCIALKDGLCPDMEGWTFAPGCEGGGNNAWHRLQTQLEKDADDEDTTSNDGEASNGNTVCLTNSEKYLMQCVEINLAMEHNVIQFDFYNDWLNGVLYLPRWYGAVRPKRKYLSLLGDISKEKLMLCDESIPNDYRRYFTDSCSLEYAETEKNSGIYNHIVDEVKCNKKKNGCVRKRNRIRVFNNGGLIKTLKNSDDITIYYIKPCEFIENGTKKIPLFATDIVLLGSLNERDINGIPNVFDYLRPTSYILPPNLAATNFDKEGIMYGIDGYSSCSKNERTEESLSIISPDTYDAYKKWSKTTYDSYDSDVNDSTEYPVTEISGIDWGYVGPLQQNNENNKLVRPGGHFLSISCVASETTIKTCTNLTRICELGSSLSSRKQIPTYNIDKGEIEYKYTTPNGIISKDDIISDDFRSKFATLNSNNLKTKMTNKSYEYDLIYFNPNGFDGSMGAYKSFVDTPIINKNEIGSRLLDYLSPDYYYFRFGTTRPDSNSFLIKKGSNVSMPVFENSFYFYFGLRNGSTAIERFYNDYYSKCENENEEENSVYYDVNGTDTDFCVENGSITILAANLDDNLNASLFKHGEDGGYIKFTYEGNKSGFDVYTKSSDDDIIHLFTESDKVILSGLGEGLYDLSLSTKGKTVSEFSVNINTKKPEEISKLVDYISVVPFKFEVEEYQIISNNYAQKYTNYDGVTKNYGYIKFPPIDGFFDNISSLCVCDGRYFSVAVKDSDNKFKPSVKYTSKYSKIWGEYLNNTELTCFIVDGTTSDISVWQEDMVYTVFATYVCGDGVEKILNIGNYDIGLEDPQLNVYFTDKDFTYARDIKYDGLSGNNWWLMPLKNDSNSKKSWNLKRSLYMTRSVYLGLDNKIKYTIYGGNAPYTITVSGQTDALENGNIVIKNETPYDLEHILYPTITQLKDGNINNGGIVKKPYTLAIKDSLITNSGITINNIPLIYKPFYFFATIVIGNWSKYGGGRDYGNTYMKKDEYVVRVINGITYGNEKPKVIIEDENGITTLDYQNNNTFNGSTNNELLSIEGTENDEFSITSKFCNYNYKTVNQSKKDLSLIKDKWSTDLSINVSDVVPVSVSDRFSPNVIYEDINLHFYSIEEPYSDDGIRYYAVKKQVTQGLTNTDTLDERLSKGFTGIYKKIDKNGNVNNVSIGNADGWYDVATYPIHNTYFARSGGQFLSLDENEYNQVIGIYSPLTQLSDESLYNIVGDTYTVKSWETLTDLIPKHTNFVSIVKKYSMSDFKKIVNSVGSENVKYG